MKITCISLLAITIACSQAVHANSWCGNQNRGGTAGAGQDGSTGPGGGMGDPVVPYTGNEFKRVDDLQIWSAVGTIPMRWSRHANSRATAGSSLFGMAHYWRHSFQWEMAAASKDSSGRSRMSLIYPDGGQFTFTEVSPGSWASNWALTDKLLPTSDGFVVLRKDASRHFFRKVASGNTFFFLMDQIQDSDGNAYSLEYNASRQVTKITEPAGRFFRISYATLTGNRRTPATLGTQSAAPAPGAWMEFTVTNATAFRYVSVQQADRSFGNIAEIEFYEAETHARLTGTMICSDSTLAGQAALDGNPATAFVSAAQSGGYVGLDLGSAKKIGRVRVLSLAGKESLHKPAQGASLKTDGANAAPISVSAVSRVETNDGRSVTYEYTPIGDPTLPYVFPALTAAVYGDGTRGEYKHIQVFPGSRPLVSEWDDARYGLPMVRYKTVY